MMSRKAILLNAVALALGASSLAHAGAFVSGNDLVIVRLGDGSAPLGTAAASVFLDEYNVSGATPTLVNTVALPAAGAGALTMSALANHDGVLYRSADGQYLTLAGYRYAANGAADPATLSTSVVPRVVGRVGANGVADTSTTIVDAYDGLAFRSAATIDGTKFWVSGDGQPAPFGPGGARYVAGVGGTSSVALGLVKPDGSSPPYENVRSASIFGGQLYVTSGSNSSIGKAAFKAGTGMPTAAPTQLSVVESADSTNDIFLLDLDPANGVDAASPTHGVDTLYASTSDTLRKFSFVAGSWVANGNASLSGIESLTASVGGSGMTVFAATPNSIYRLNDSSGYNGALGATFGSPYIMADGISTQFRGLALAPVPEPAAAGIFAACMGAAAMARRRR